MSQNPTQSMTTRIHIIGTGLTALALAGRLQQSAIAKSLHIALIDKARAPGGRLTSRQVARGSQSSDNDLTLEPGARVFQSSGQAFDRQCVKWENEGLIREVPRAQLRGVGDERWWEAGKGGWSGSLIKGLVDEINGVGGDRVSWHYNTTIDNTYSSQTAATATEKPTPNPDIIVYTPPTPQTVVLLPDVPHTRIDYRMTFALMYPGVTIKGLPVYWRDPHPSLSAISTGRMEDGTTAGLVLQASPQQLGLHYEKDKSGDKVVRQAFESAVERSGLLPDVKLSGEAVQLKRWKFAQVAKPPGGDAQMRVVKSSDSKLVLVAGDGESTKGGVEGSWESAQAAADRIVGWIGKQHSSSS